MDQKLKVAEGIVIDTINGTIGFRNHTVPTNLPYGAEWEEDILFLEPESVCVNTNLTAWSQVYSNGTFANATAIVDRGGFANINRSAPSLNNDTLYKDGQRNPMLYERAYYAAWNLNVLTMAYLDIADPQTLSQISSTLGQRHALKIGDDLTSESDLFQTTDLSSLPNPPNTDSYWNVTGKYNETSNDFENPYNISTISIADLEADVTLTGQDAPIDINKVAVQIGLTLGIGRRVDNTSSTETKPQGTPFPIERDMYVCSSATKAVIKTVRFRFDSTINKTTDALDGLDVLFIRDKQYTNEDAVIPTWGFENPKPTYNVSTINPLWGIIDPSFANNANITTIQSSHFYIPQSQVSYASDYSILGSDCGDNLPGIRAPSELWAVVFSGLGSSQTFSYTGQNNQQLRSFWSSMAVDANGFSKALRLIWTDFASNYLVGTKGLHTNSYVQPSVNGLQKRATASGSQPVHTVWILRHRIRGYNFLYGIPAIICVCICTGAILLALKSMLAGRGTVAQLRFYLFNVTSGRVLAAYVYPEQDTEGRRYSSTSKWVTEVGHKPIQISGKAEELELKSRITYRWSNVSESSKKPGYVKVTEREGDDDGNVKENP